MTKIRLTKEFSFEAAHLLEGYDGACREIHGHSYRLFVTVRGVPVCDGRNPKLGMVMDFGQLKRIVGEEVVQRLDHAFVMRRTPAGEAFAGSARHAVRTDCVRRLPADVREHARRLRRPHRAAAARRSGTLCAPTPRDGHLLRRVGRRRQQLTVPGSRPRNLCPTGLRRHKSDSDEKTVSGRCLRTDL